MSQRPGTPIPIVINGQARQIAPGTTVADLLRDLQLLGRSVAVELNARVIPRNRYADQELASGDRLEIVTLVGGG